MRQILLTPHRMGGTCIRALQRNSATRIHRDIQKEIHHEGLPPTITEAGKSHDQPSAGWRPREAGDMIAAQTWA